MKIRGREGRKKNKYDSVIGKVLCVCVFLSFFPTDHETCELPVISNTLLNAAEYVVMGFNKPCPAWSGRAAVKWLKPVISSLTNKSSHNSNANDSNACLGDTNFVEKPPEELC